MPIKTAGQESFFDRMRMDASEAASPLRRAVTSQTGYDQFAGLQQRPTETCHFFSGSILR
jgi:hypothetical protein